MTYKIMLGALLAATSFSSVNAATIYTNRAAFQAAISGDVTDTFEENASVAFTNYGSVYNGGTFSIAGGTCTPSIRTTSRPITNEIRAMCSISRRAPERLPSRPPSPRWVSTSAIPTTSGRRFRHNQRRELQPDRPAQFNFWGITDSNPISTVSWNGGLGIMDNVTTGFAGAIPEPSTWAILLLGFFAVGSAMRSRRATTRVAYS